MLELPPDPHLLLLVDDSVEDRHTCRRLLRRAQPGAFSFAEASSVEEGLLRAREATPWCVLVDYNLPDGNGLALVERLRESPSCPPVVMLTGVGDERIAAEALKNGVQDYIPKSDLNATLLARVVERAVEKHALQQQVVAQQRETEAANDRLRALNATLEELVAERTRALTHSHDELKKAHQALKQRNHELGEFAYVASHDLQEPLRKIRTFASLLLTDYGPALPDEAKHFTERMSDAAERMSVLLSDLLAYSRASKPSPHVGEVDLNAVVRDVLRDLEIATLEADARVEVGTLCKVEAAASHMRQIFQNLIANAIKFSRDGVQPVIRITSTDVDENGTPPLCRISVADNGIGFDDKYTDRIFSPFQRLHSTNRYAGTGMGLAICRRLTQHYHGDITARSTPGEGSTFEVTLPLHQPASRNRTALAQSVGV